MKSGVEMFTIAFDDPIVKASWIALSKVINHHTSGELVTVSNYADMKVSATIEALQARGLLTAAIIDELVLVYSEFVDALTPFQPSPEFLAEAAQQPSRPWDMPLPPPDEGEVFYFLPGSGGYWVCGKHIIRDELEKVKQVLGGF